MLQSTYCSPFPLANTGPKSSLAGTDAQPKPVQVCTPKTWLNLAAMPGPELAHILSSSGTRPTLLAIYISQMSSEVTTKAFFSEPSCCLYFFFFLQSFQSHLMARSARKKLVSRPRLIAIVVDTNTLTKKVGSLEV